MYLLADCSSILFPYTTLFRSFLCQLAARLLDYGTFRDERAAGLNVQIGRAPSELQSPMYLVFRLLLEKKKTPNDLRRGQCPARRNQRPVRAADQGIVAQVLQR